VIRYVCLAWNSIDPEQSAAARLLKDRLCSPWTKVLEQPGLWAAHMPLEHPQDAVIAVQDTGVLFGTIFRNNASRNALRRCTTFSPEEAADISVSDGRSLVSNFWGSYVLILRNPAHAGASVLRGPMARLPCFHCVYAGVQVFFSSMNDCARLNALRFSINWDCVVAQVAHGDYLTHETGLNEVSAIVAGECVHTGPGRVSNDFYWDPRKEPHYNHISDFTEATEQLRSATERSIAAWASDHDKVLHTLSGGLDSSIVLSCLGSAPNKPQLLNVNYYSRESGDERHFARSMAHLTGTNLVEKERDPAVDLRVFLDCERTAQPVLHFNGCYSERSNARLAGEFGATAIFDGELGDNVFGSAAGDDVLLEYVRQHGMTSSFFAVAMDYALLKRESIWRALKIGLLDRLTARPDREWSGHLFSKRKLHLDPAACWLVSQQALDSYEPQRTRFIHPWLKDVSQTPVGKFQLIYGLMMITSTAYLSPFLGPSAPSIISPLGSQPVVDTALRIDSHLNIAGGQDRAVARAAFGKQLSRPVLQRGTGKGTADQWIRDTIKRNNRFLREVLLDGTLVARGILDRKKIESLLSTAPQGSTAFPADIIVQLYIECWVRTWLDTKQRAAA